MNGEILLALLSFAGTLIGTLAGIFAAQRLTSYRLEQLEKKVDKHNNLIERVYRLEQNDAVLENRMKTADHRISDLESTAMQHGKQ